MNPFDTGKLSRARIAAADRAKAKAQREYRTLIVQAAIAGGLYALSSDERDRLVELATAIGLPDHHEMERDIERIQREPEAREELRQAEIEVSMIPTVAESQSEIDDCNQIIHDQLEGVLLPYKRQQIVLIERRQEAEEMLRQARHRLDLIYSGREHLQPDRES